MGDWLAFFTNTFTLKAPCLSCTQYNVISHCPIMMLDSIFIYEYQINYFQNNEKQSCLILRKLRGNTSGRTKYALYTLFIDVIGTIKHHKRKAWALDLAMALNVMNRGKLLASPSGSMSNLYKPLDSSNECLNLVAVHPGKYLSR